MAALGPGSAGLAKYNALTDLKAAATTYKLNTYITAALDTTSTKSTASFSDKGRAEMAKKGMMNVLPLAIAHAKMVSAVSKEAAAKGTGAADWLYAWATYTGTNDGSAPLKADGSALASPVASSGCTAYVTANKRCGNYDTCVASPTTDKSTTNQKIMVAFKAGASAANHAIIMAQFSTVYYQATLRYANKMDKENAGGTSSSGKNQGEGEAFSRVLGMAPGLSSAEYAKIQALYDASKENKLTSNYCTMKTILALSPATGMTAADLGVLNEATAQSCIAAEAAAVQAGGIGSTATYDKLTEIKTAAKATADIDAYVVAALKGPSTASFSDKGRAEMIKKALMNQLPILTMKALATSAVVKETAAKGTGAADWKKASVVFTGTYTGTSPYKADGSALAVPVAWAGATAYVTANKRCGNYDTCVASPTTDKSMTNQKIMAAFKAGASAGSAAVAVGQVGIVYFQATLRYANKMDKENAAGGISSSGKNQGEGGAFARCINDYLPAGEYAKIAAMYDSKAANTATDNYVKALAILKANMPTGTTAGDLGTLNELPKAAPTVTPADAGSSASMAQISLTLMVAVALAMYA